MKQPTPTPEPDDPEQGEDEPPVIMEQLQPEHLEIEGLVLSSCKVSLLELAGIAVELLKNDRVMSYLELKKTKRMLSSPSYVGGDE